MLLMGFKNNLAKTQRRKSMRLFDFVLSHLCEQNLSDSLLTQKVSIITFSIFFIIHTYKLTHL